MNFQNFQETLKLKTDHLYISNDFFEHVQLYIVIVNFKISSIFL